MKFNNNNNTSNFANFNTSLLNSIKRARKALGLDPNTSSTPMKKFETKGREVIDVTHVIGKIETKKVKTVKKTVEIKKNPNGNFGMECRKFATPLDYLHSCYKKKEIVTAAKPIVPMSRELVSERIVTIVGFSSPKLIRVGKVERPLSTPKKGVETPKRPVQMKRTVRLEKGMANLGHFLSLGVNKGERHYNSSSQVDLNVHIDRIADFLSFSEAITKEGNKINVVFCKDGIEIIGHASKEKVYIDGISYKWSYECEFISTLIAVLKRLGFIVTGVDGNRQVVIPSTNKTYEAIKLIVSGLADKCINIVMDTADRAMNVVAGEVKVGLQTCSEVTFERRSSLKIKIGGRELLPNDDLNFNNISDLTIGETELSFTYNDDLDNIYIVSNFNSSNDESLFELIRGEYIAYCATDAELHHILTTLYYEEIVGVDLQECALTCNYKVFDSETGWNLQVDKYGEKISFLVTNHHVCNTEVEYYNFKTNECLYVTRPEWFSGDTWKSYRFKVGTIVVDCTVNVLSNNICMDYMSTKDGIIYETVFVDTTEKMLTRLKNIWYEYVNSQINLQMCGLENYELCTFDKRVINDVPWVTPVLCNENIIIENTEENKSLIKSFSKVESDIKGTYVFLNSRITIDGVEYAAFDLEAKIMGYYFCCNNSQYQDEMLAIKVDEKYACIPKPSSSLKYEENMGVIKFVAQTCKDELMLKRLMMAREYEFLNSPEFIPSLIKMSDFGFYSEYEAMYSEWEMPTRASEFLEVANLTTKDMIKYLAPLEFNNTNALALTMLEHCHCVMGNKLAKRLFKVDITTIEGKYEVFNLKWMAVLNALLPISESKTINQWEELFIKSALCPEYNVDNSETNCIALEYGKMLYNLSGKVIVHCKNDGFNFPARGEICCSLIDKNHIATWYGYGFLMAPNPKAIKALFNRDVWSERIDNGKRKISNYKSIKEHHVVINCSEAMRTDWHNEMWVELSETKPVAGFYDKNMCDYENFIELTCFCDSVGIPCYEIHDWNNIQRFSFSGDYYSYDHIIEENKELEYVDKYEYIDMQMCGAIDIHVTTNNMECFVDGYVDGQRIFGIANCIGMKKGPSCSLFTSSPKHTELRGLVIGAEEATRLGYKELTFVNVSKKTIKLLKYGCPAIDGDIFRAMFKKLTEKLNVNFVNRKVNTVEEINLQLFADNNTGSSVPEPNGDERRGVKKETSSLKEGVNKMTTNINTTNNTISGGVCQTPIYKDVYGQKHITPRLVVMQQTYVSPGKFSYKSMYEISPIKVKEMIEDYIKAEGGESQRKVIEGKMISNLFTSVNSLNYFDAIAKQYEVKLVAVDERNLKNANCIIDSAISDVNKNQLEDIFKAQLIMGSESSLAKLKGCKAETYNELLGSMIANDPQNRTMSFVDISSAAKVVARLKSPRSCNEVISLGINGDKRARVLIVPNSQQAGYTWVDEQFAENFKLLVTKKYTVTGRDIRFYTNGGVMTAAQVLDIYEQEGGNIFEGVTALNGDMIAKIDGDKFVNEWAWEVAPRIKHIESNTSVKDDKRGLEYTVTIWLEGATHLTSGCKPRGVISPENIMTKGEITEFSDSIGLKSVILVGEDIRVEVKKKRTLKCKYDAIIPTEAIKFPTFIKNHMGSTFKYVTAKVWDYKKNAMVWKECVEGVMELGFESPTGEGRGNYKRVHEKFIQSYGFIQATKSLKGLLPNDVIDGIVSWYEDSRNANLAEGISLIKGIKGESHVEYQDISLADFCKLTDGEIIGNENGYRIKSLNGNSELEKPVCIPKGKLIYRFFSYCPSDIENLGKDDIVAQMTRAENPDSIRMMKGGLRKMINVLRDINAENSLPLVNEIEEARQRMIYDAVEHTKDFFSSSFDGGCFTVIYADWLKGDVCGLENSKHKYCSIGRQPYTNFWLNFVEVQDMETISKHSPFKISSRFSKNVVVLPFSKANPTHGDSDGDFAIIKFINDIIAKRWIKSGINARLEKEFASQFKDPSQRKLNNLLKEVDIRKFFETKVYTYGYDELAHFSAMACHSKANTRTTTSLAYTMGLILGLAIEELNVERNKVSEVLLHLSFNGAFFKLVQDAIDGIKADTSTLDVDSIRTAVVEFLQSDKGMAAFFNICQGYKISNVTTEHQIECINRIRERVLSTGKNAESVYGTMKGIVNLTSGKMDHYGVSFYARNFNEDCKVLCPEVFATIKRYLAELNLPLFALNNDCVAMQAREELNTMGITDAMLQPGDPKAISDKERAKGETRKWVSQHISKYANSADIKCLTWNDKAKKVAQYICSQEFEATYQEYNENGKKVMSRIGKLASLAITVKDGKVFANTETSGKLFSALQSNASGDKVKDAEFNRTETRRVIGLIMLVIAWQKHQTRNSDYWFSAGSKVLANVNAFTKLCKDTEARMSAEMAKKEEEEKQHEANTKGITVADVTSAKTADTPEQGIDLQLFASKPKRGNNNKPVQLIIAKRERITLKKATRGVVLSELGKLNDHSIKRGRGPLPIEIQVWFLEHRMGFDWSIGKCSGREEVHCSYTYKLFGKEYYCMIYKHNDCNQVYPATIFPITSDKDIYAAKNMIGYSVINFIK